MSRLCQQSWIRAAHKQLLHAVDVAQRHCRDQWRIAVIVSQVDIGPKAHEHGDGCWVPGRDGRVKGSPAKRRPRIYLSASLDELEHERHVIVSGRNMHGRDAAAVCTVYHRAKVEKSCRHCCMVGSDRKKKRRRALLSGSRLDLSLCEQEQLGDDDVAKLCRDMERREAVGVRDVWIAAELEKIVGELRVISSHSIQNGWRLLGENVNTLLAMIVRYRYLSIHLAL